MAMTPRREYRKYSRPVLKTKRWQALRHQILERDGWKCRACGTRRGRLEIDHIRPVKHRPEAAFDPANLQTLCSRCHAKKTRIEVGWAPVFDNPERQAWGNLLRDMQRNPSSNEVKNA